MTREDAEGRYAAAGGHVECANVVLEYGANANVRSEADSDTPMHKAVREGHMPLVTLLIKHRADLSVSPAPLCAAKPAFGGMCHVAPGSGSQACCPTASLRVRQYANKRPLPRCPQLMSTMLTCVIDLATGEDASTREHEAKQSTSKLTPHTHTVAKHSRTDGAAACGAMQTP